MAEQLGEKGTIVLVKPQTSVRNSQESVVSVPRIPVSLRRFKVARTIVPRDERESSDWTIARKLVEKMRAIAGIESSVVNRALEGNINHHPTERFEIEQEILEGQENLVGDVITAEDGSVLSFKEITEQHNLLPGQVESGLGLIPLTNLENQDSQTVKTYDVGIISARKSPQISPTQLKKQLEAQG